MTEHRHLRRLPRVFSRSQLYFITVCTIERARVLSSPTAAKVLISEWHGAHERHGWMVGRYVIMPDHVHFFAGPAPDAVSLQRFVGAWKEWTSKHLHRECAIGSPLWQPQFFDHLLRSAESYAEKWEYVRQNPVRAGLVNTPEEWPFAGHIDFE